jgi:L-ascorbate metabolism protein UlaG (beta-lactamase superfamily)
MIINMILISQLSAQDKTADKIKFSPVKHGTMVIETSEVTIYVDPVGDIKAFETFPSPDIILITDIHGDHLDPDAVNALKQDKTVIIAPGAVVDRLDEGEILNNGESKTITNVNIEAIPMYNLTEGRLKYHEKGRGNGYVISADNKRIYISGDTEDIKEMRNLKDIDYAFVCMNLPYTMSVEQAASAVLEMKPAVVLPYHYRGTEGFSDIEKFKQLVSADENIEVRLLNWYH